MFIQARIDRYAKALNSHRSFRDRGSTPVIRFRCRPADFGRGLALVYGHPRNDESKGRVINAANILRISPAGFDTRARPYISGREVISRGRMLIASNDRFLDFDRLARVSELPSSSINPESNVLRLSDLILLGHEMYGVMTAYLPCTVSLRCLRRNVRTVIPSLLLLDRREKKDTRPLNPES